MISNLARCSRTILFRKSNLNQIGFYPKIRSESTLAGMYQSIAQSTIVQSTMDQLIAFHDWSNLPWFAEITIVTFLARSLVAFPLTVIQRRIFLRYEALKPEIDQISKNLRKSIQQESYITGITKARAQKIYRRRFTQQVNRLIERDNCHPIKATLVVMFQIPLWVILSNCYRNLARLYPDPNNPARIMAFQQLQQEGTLWFTDLTMPDPIGILPVFTCLINLTIIQIIVNERKQINVPDSLLVRVITNGGRFISVALIPLGLVMPADLTYYWCNSSMFGLVQNLILINPKMRRLLNIEKQKEM